MHHTTPLHAAARSIAPFLPGHDMNTGVLRDVNGTVHRKNRTGIYAKQHDNATAPPLVVPHKRLPSVFLEVCAPFNLTRRFVAAFDRAGHQC